MCFSASTLPFCTVFRCLSDGLALECEQGYWKSSPFFVELKYRMRQALVFRRVHSSPRSMFRSTAKASASVAFVSLLLTGCPKNVTETPTQPAVVETQTVGNLKKESIDLNNDKKPDIWNYYSTEGKSRLVRKETDLNFDGKPDVISHYEGGQVGKEEVDADFDNKIDWVDYFGEGGKRTRQEWDTDFDGKVNLWKYFDAGKLIRKERDTDNNGKPDYFEFYENDQVTRRAFDTDGDGKEDTYE